MQIDKTFAINLPARPDRREHINNELSKHGFDFRLWRAIKMDNGAQGLLKTMTTLFEHCIAMNFHVVAVFEDDAEFICDNPKETIEKYLQQVPKDFYCLKLGYNLLTQPKRIKENIIKISMSYATHATIYSMEAMKYILPFLDVAEAFDLILKDHVEPLGKVYGTKPMLCTQTYSKSDIFEYKPEIHKGVIDQYYKDEVINWGLFMSNQNERMTKNI